MFSSVFIMFSTDFLGFQVSRNFLGGSRGCLAFFHISLSFLMFSLGFLGVFQDFSRGSCGFLCFHWDFNSQ